MSNDTPVSERIISWKRVSTCWCFKCNKQLGYACGTVCDECGGDFMSHDTSPFARIRTTAAKVNIQKRWWNPLTWRGYEWKITEEAFR